MRLLLSASFWTTDPIASAGHPSFPTRLPIRGIVIKRNRGLAAMMGETYLFLKRHTFNQQLN
jgi:hypothetical protein